jgi:mRNA deadenylase 3'-5' endonuclease subunit Ccr4
MGDLNSTPGVSPLQFLEMNQITPLALVNSWDRLSYFAWGKDASETEENSVDVGKQLAAEFRKKEQFYEENPIAFLNENDIGPLPIEFFQHSLNLVNTSKDITYTNYTVAFKELLDYIFISKDSFEVIRSAPMPSLEELQEETAMPSSVFPSDHLSIAIDVKYL